MFDGSEKIYRQVKKLNITGDSQKCSRSKETHVEGLDLNWSSVFFIVRGTEALGQCLEIVAKILSSCYLEFSLWEDVKP